MYTHVRLAHVQYSFECLTYMCFRAQKTTSTPYWISWVWLVTLETMNTKSQVFYDQDHDCMVQDGSFIPWFLHIGVEHSPIPMCRTTLGRDIYIYLITQVSVQYHELLNEWAWYFHEPKASERSPQVQ